MLDCTFLFYTTRVAAIRVAALLLQLPDLASMATELIKHGLTRDSIIPYCLSVDSHIAANQNIKDALFSFLCTGIVRETMDVDGLVWGNPGGKGYAVLVGLFSELPFEWLKSVIESPHFEVPSDMERY